MVTLYRMSDLPRADRAAIPVGKLEAASWNTPDRGFGIFMTVNDFGGQPRRKENLRRVLAWPVDIDTGTKQEQHDRLQRSPLIPSMIVETKRGYQAWWIAKDGTPEHWNAIVLERLVPFFGADANARDLCRILRVPGFLHLKDPADPFLIREVHRTNVAYTERQMAAAFRWVPDVKSIKAAEDDKQRKAASESRARARAAALSSGQLTESLWDAIYALDCEEGLRRLSGHSVVSGEQFTLKRVQNGNLNIYVNGKLTSAFVDKDKRIGSSSKGGPTLIQWVMWYGADYKTAIAVLKDLFPHLVDIDKAQRRAA